MPPIDFGAPVVPPEFEALANQEDELIGETLSVVVPIPEKPYNPKVVTALGNAIAEVAKLMGLDLGEGSFDGPQESLDPDMVRFLAMMSEAAAEFGSPLPVALEDIKGDNELTALTAALTSLAKDRDFKDFINEPIPDDAPGTDLPDEGIEVGDPEPDDDEFDFSSRIRI